MQGSTIGADFFEIWSTPETVPSLTSLPDREPTERPFTIMPPTGHLIRIIDIYPSDPIGNNGRFEGPEVIARVEPREPAQSVPAQQELFGPTETSAKRR